MVVTRRDEVNREIALLRPRSLSRLLGNGGIMALSKKIHEALNEQVGREFLAHFLYRAIALDLYDKGYEGFAAWMEQHATEEYGHAERIINFLRENDARVELSGVPKIPTQWDSVQDA